MNFSDILSFSATTAVLTFALNQGVSIGKEIYNRSEKRKYQGLRIALKLERFAIDCAGLIHGQTAFINSHGSTGSSFSTLPTFELPEVEWNLFPLHLTNTVLSFENDIRDANASISFAIDYDSADDGTEEPSEQAGLCGYRASHLADLFRKKYDLGSPEAALHGWDRVSFLKDLHDKKLSHYRSIRGIQQ